MAKGRKVSDWLSRTVKDNKDKRDRKIFDMWLACSTQEEIAEAVECDQATAKRTADDFMQSVLKNQTHKSAASHATDFTPPIYNIWKQQEKTEGSSHFGHGGGNGDVGTGPAKEKYRKFGIYKRCANWRIDTKWCCVRVGW